MAAPQRGKLLSGRVAAKNSRAEHKYSFTRLGSVSGPLPRIRMKQRFWRRRRDSRWFRHLDAAFQDRRPPAPAKVANAITEPKLARLLIKRHQTGVEPSGSVRDFQPFKRGSKVPHFALPPPLADVDDSGEKTGRQF